MTLLPQNDGAYGVSIQASGGSGTGTFQFNNKNIMKFDLNNDISFYEDTGTTPKLVWKSADERLGIGTSSPASGLELEGVGNSTNITLDNTTASTGRSYSIRSGNTGNLDFYDNDATNARMVIDASGNVGIGTSSPDATGLHVHTGSAGSLTPNSAADDLVVESNGNAGITIASPDANYSGIIFSSPTDTTGSIIEYNYSGATFDIGTATSGGVLRLRSGNFSETMRLDASGNVGIGCTPSAHAFSKAIQIGDGAVWTVSGNQNTTFASNAYLASNGSFKYIAANKASKINLYNGGFTVATTNTSGSANGDITFTDRLTVNSQGNVGIGTSSPASPAGFGTGGILHLKGSTGNDCSIVLEGLTGSGGRQEIGASGGALQFYRGAATGSMTESMRIDSSGNVGIGITAPSQRLQVDSKVTGTNQGVPSTSGTTQNGILRLTPGDLTYGETLDFGMNVAPTYAWIQSTNRDNLGVNYNLSLNPNGGNVGIGTTSPNQWASYTDSAATVLQVKDTSQRARIVINGGNGAHLDLVDYAGSANDKHMNIAVDAGVLKFGSLNDAGSAFVQNNIMVMDLGTGNVGIGTTSTGYKLDVAGTGRIGNTLSVGDGPASGPIPANTLIARMGESSTTGGPNSGNSYFPIVVGGGTHLAGRAFGIGFDPEGYGNRNKVAIMVEGDNQGYSHGKLHFALNSAVDSSNVQIADSKMTILKTGNVGIGTASPAATLDVKRDTNTVNNLDSLGFDVAGIIGNAGSNPGNHYSSGIRIFQGSGSVGSGLGVFNIGVDNGTATTANQYTAQLIAPSGMTGGISLSTGGAARMRIASSGNVGIGTTSTSPGDKLTIEGSGAQVLSIYSTDTGSQSTAKTFINLYGENTNGDKRLQGQIASAPGHNASNAGELHFSTNNSSSALARRMTIREDGNVGIGTSSPTALLEISAGAPTLLLNANTQATDKKKVRIALSQYTAGDFNIQQMNDAGTTVLQNAMTITNAGNIAVGGTSAPNAPTHKQNTTITSSNSLTGTWTAPAAGGTYNYRNSIEVGGILNRHIGKWGFSGNFSANTWYPFVKRSELTSMYRAASGSEDGFTLYFRIYLYPTTSGIGEYFSNRMSEMVYIQSSGSNSTTWHELRIGAGWGHAPNAGTDFDPDDRFSGFGPVRLRIQHHLGSDSNFPAEQTIDINFASAVTGLDPDVAGRQVLIYGYML